jgi:ADP-ribose pyrophosphatase YjhB (NUDIX family)
MPDRLVKFNKQKMTDAKKRPQWKRRDDKLVLFNKKLGVYIKHVMLEKNGTIEHDRILRAEQGGGVCLILDDKNRIYLQMQRRFQTRNQEKWSKKFPHYDPTALGRESWEIPRGFAKQGETAYQAAKREGGEESGLTLRIREELGYICDNNTFSPHLTAVAWCEKDPAERTARTSDPCEQIERRCFFTLKELAELQQKGKVYDAMTLSAVAMLLLRHPELLK